ncbi:MAG: hypothetical protein OHK0052_12620 [Anaerolineales bacterium]
MRFVSIVQIMVLIGILMGAAACSSAPATTPNAVQVTPSATAIAPTPTYTAIPVTATATPLPSATPEPPPPAGDALEQLLREVQAGRYTLEEGLTQSLEVLLNGGTLPLDASQPVIEPHLTTLVRYADYYLETGSDAAAKTVLAETLSRLFPSESDLDAVARPEGSSRAPWGLASIPNGCSFEEQCLIYREIFINGSRFKIYYPAVAGPRSGRWWEGQLTAAVDAVNYTVPYYNSLGRGNMRGVTILFRPDGDAQLGSPDYAITRFAEVRNGNACPILINPAVARISAQQFQQVLAHELFHCYEAQIFQAQTLGAFPANEWWAEGTAEYFSSLVFPGVRFEESQFVGLFDRRVRESLPVVKMKYESLVFFHYLHNSIGRAGILNLIQSMPTSGGIAQQAEKLAAFNGMQDLWLHFAQNYYDKQLRRANGELFGVNPPEPSLRGVAAGATENFLVQTPFTIQAYRILFNPGQGFDMRISTSGAEGRSSAQAAGSRTWTGLPSTLGKECNPREYLLLVTTTNGQDAPHSLDLRSTETDEASCSKDRCLIGKWQVVPNIFWLQFSRLGQDPNAAIYRIYEATDGTMYLTFTEDGRFTMEFAKLTAIMADRVENALDQNVTVKMRGIINGGGNSDYFVMQPGVLGFRNGGGEGLMFTFEVNNAVVSTQRVTFPAGGADTGTAYYKCYENALFYDPFTPNGGEGIWAWQFTRVAGP